MGTLHTDLQAAYDLLAPCPRLSRLLYPYTRLDSSPDFHVTIQSEADVPCIINKDAFHSLSFERVILDSSSPMDPVLSSVEEAAHVYLIVRSENDLS